MKKIFLLILLSISTRVSYAQLNLGLKLNWNINKFDLKSNNDDVFIKNTLVDFDFYSLSGGVMGNYKLNQRFSIQSELIFDAFKTNYTKMEYYTNWQGERTIIGNEFDVRMNYLEIPFMWKASFGRKVTFDIQGGGYVGYLLSAKHSTYNGKLNMSSDTIYNTGDDPEPKIIDFPKQSVRSDYTSFNAGVLIGLGVTIYDKMVFELRLNRGLVNINKKGSAQMYTIQGQFTVGYYLFRQKNKA